MHLEFRIYVNSTTGLCDMGRFTELIKVCKLYLTHCDRDKIDAISQTILSNALNENVRILIKITLKFVPKGPINNIPALVYIMA